MVIHSNQYCEGLSFQLTGVCTICWCTAQEEGGYSVATVISEYFCFWGDIYHSSWNHSCFWHITDVQKQKIPLKPQLLMCPQFSFGIDNNQLCIACGIFWSPSMTMPLRGHHHLFLSPPFHVSNFLWHCSSHPCWRARCTGSWIIQCNGDCCVQFFCTLRWGSERRRFIVEFYFFHQLAFIWPYFYHFLPRYNLFWYNILY